MEIAVDRQQAQDVCTIGKMSVDGVEKWFTLEDVVREIAGAPVESWKIQNQTAIPRGRYRVIIDASKRFGRAMPHILDVPGFTSIRIHGGNTAADTEGCILIGMHQISHVAIGDCAPALEELIDEMQLALANDEEIWVTVS